MNLARGRFLPAWFLFLAGAGSTAVAAPPLSPDPAVVEYRIEVKLDPATKKLAGRENVVWRNPSGESIGELRFHLYLNAFRNNRSTFMRESGGTVRREEIDYGPGDWGWIEVRSMRTAAGQELRSGFRFVQPDSLEQKSDSPDSEDRTVLAVHLPEPVPPHGEIALAIDFEAKLPLVAARTGTVGDFFLAGQWFPKLGVYEPAGMRGRSVAGWNCHQFHARSEFYADFGSYDVTIDAPSRFVVGATGKLAATTRQGDRVRHRYVQKDVHDFAWTASPRFVVHDFRFDPQRDVPRGWRQEAARLLGVEPASLELRPVAVRILMSPEHDEQWTRYRDALNFGFAYYGLRYGAYPYDTFTLVDPPEGARGAAGMEYPTLVTGQMSAGLGRWPFSGIRLPEVVAIHEVGHQWWQSMVASNEFEEPWLDEGLNSYSEARVMDAAYHGAQFELPGGLELAPDAAFRASLHAVPALDPIVRDAWNYFSARSAGVNWYGKAALALVQLEERLGEATFARCLRSYFEEWSFRHPTTRDFFDVCERVSGQDLDDFRDAVFYGTRGFDLFIASARSEPSEGRRGVFTPGKPALDDKGTKVRYRTAVVVGRTGELAQGAEVELVFTDGVRLTAAFPAEAPGVGSPRWVRYRVERDAKLAWAAVDPGLRNRYDANLLNNSKRSSLDRAAVAKFATKLQYLVVTLLQALWGLA